MSDNDQPRKPTPPPGHRSAPRVWTGNRIKSDPFIERKRKNARGEVVGERSVEEMLRMFRKRVSKSGRLAEYKDRQRFTKPSDERRAKRRDTEYRIRKQAEREKELERMRTMGL